MRRKPLPPMLPGDEPIFLDMGASHLTIFDLLWMRHFPGKKPAAVASWIKRRCKDEWIRARQFDRRRSMYQLTDKAVAQLRKLGHSISRSTTSEPRGYAKATRYAAMLRCTPQGGAPLHLYRPSEHPDKFPDLAAHIQKTNSDPFRQKLFYADGDILGYLVLDRGQPAFFRRKVVPHLHQLFGRPKRLEQRTVIDPEEPGWPSMQLRLKHDKVRLTIVTVTQPRREELEREIAESTSSLPTEVVVFPDIANVMPMQRRPNGRQQTLPFSEEPAK